MIKNEESIYIEDVIEPEFIKVSIYLENDVVHKPNMSAKEILGENKSLGNYISEITNKL